MQDEIRLYFSLNHKREDLSGSWEITPVTRLAFEREHGRSVLGAMTADNPMEGDFMWIFWHGTRVATGHRLSLDEFVEGLVSYAMDDGKDDDPKDPDIDSGDSLAAPKPGESLPQP